MSFESIQIFDAHFHIIDGSYPLVESDGYLPPEFTIEDYKNQTEVLNITGGAIISGSFHGFDQKHLVNALKIMGKNFYGVANVAAGTPDQELQELNDVNVVAVRFNLVRGGSESIHLLAYLSDKLYERFNWHTELYVDSANLKELKPKLLNLQKFSIDHLGLSKKGIHDLYYWVERGVKVKASGFGRLDFDPVPVMKQIFRINPGALMFGTDLPSTRAAIPFSVHDIDKIKENFDQAAQERIFYRNGAEWYGRE